MSEFTMQSVAAYIQASAVSLGAFSTGLTTEVDEAERMVYVSNYLSLQEQEIQVPSVGRLIPATAWVLLNNDGDELRDHPPYRSLAQAVHALLIEMLKEFIALTQADLPLPGGEPEPQPTGRCEDCRGDVYDGGAKCQRCREADELAGLHALWQSGARMSPGAALRAAAYGAELEAALGVAADLAYDAARERGMR